MEKLRNLVENMPEQETGGTQSHFLTVAIFRSWRGLAGSAAPGLPGRRKHTRDNERCQLNTVARLRGFHHWIKNEMPKLRDLQSLSISFNIR